MCLFMCVCVAIPSVWPPAPSVRHSALWWTPPSLSVYWPSSQCTAAPPPPLQHTQTHTWVHTMGVLSLTLSYFVAQCDLVTNNLSEGFTYTDWDDNMYLNRPAGGWVWLPMRSLKLFNEAWIKMLYDSLISVKQYLNIWKKSQTKPWMISTL